MNQTREHASLPPLGAAWEGRGGVKPSYRGQLTQPPPNLPLLAGGGAVLRLHVTAGVCP